MMALGGGNYALGLASAQADAKSLSAVARQQSYFGAPKGANAMVSEIFTGSHPSY